MSRMWPAIKADRARGWREEESLPSDPYAEGYAAARATIEAELAAERAMLTQMIESIAAPEAADEAALARVLAMTVTRLVHDIVGTAPIDADMLRLRCEALAAAIVQEDDAVTVSVHPDYVHLLDAQGAPFIVVGDAAVPRGTVKVRNGTGAFEDGVEHALRRLDDAFSQMGVA